MNGPEHYQEAERLLTVADGDPSQNWPTQTGEFKADLLSAAQVHATLALVAATLHAADVVHYEDRDGSRHTSPMHLDPSDGMTWDEVL